MPRHLFALLLLLAPAAQAADLFKWTDSAGQIHYSDRPPPADARNVERMKAGGNFIQSEAMPYAAKAASQKYPVSLFVFDGCGEPCNNAQALLDQRGIPYTLKNKEPDKAALQQLTGTNKVPVLVVGNQPPLTGWQENDWNSLLDLAGYPRSNPLAQFRPKPPAQPAQPTPATPSSSAPAAEPPAP